ncbi:PTS sugar transporter subunit IIA [Derxia lacustris]|uniref:PTS sugar transporter subunit IIA n=1 Tax=Derxia lacustris TaxID=764842 RepID=UPI000A178521|nr:PTS sugar transporter subunit IIA [Derxia lacustris]
MIGIVLVAHAPLGEAFASAARHVFGEVPRLAVIDVLPDAPPGPMIERVAASVEAVGDGDGVLVLTDLFGATPCNIASHVADSQTKVISGANLPMLLRAISYRREPLAVVTEKVVTGGTLGIVQVGSRAPQRQTMVPDGTRDSLRSYHQQQQQQQ